MTERVGTFQVFSGIIETPHVAHVRCGEIPVIKVPAPLTIRTSLSPRFHNVLLPERVGGVATTQNPPSVSQVLTGPRCPIAAPFSRIWVTTGNPNTLAQIVSLSVLFPGHDRRPYRIPARRSCIHPCSCSCVRHPASLALSPHHVSLRTSFLAPLPTHRLPAALARFPRYRTRQRFAPTFNRAVTRCASLPLDFSLLGCWHW